MIIGKTITVKNIVLDFEVGQATFGPTKDQVVEMVKLINEWLRGHPFGIYADLSLENVTDKDITEE